MKTTCYDVFEQCVLAVQAGALIESVRAYDKEFHDPACDERQHWHLELLDAERAGGK